MRLCGSAFVSDGLMGMRQPTSESGFGSQYCLGNLVFMLLDCFCDLSAFKFCRQLA